MTLEATYWGLQQWSVSNTIYTDPYEDPGLLAVLATAGPA